MPPWMSDAVLVSLITGLIGVISGRISARGEAEKAATVAREEERLAIIAPYTELAKRVTVLEARTTKLRSQLSLYMSRDYLWQAGWEDLRHRWPWWRDRAEPPPYPTPRLEDEPDEDPDEEEDA